PNDDPWAANMRLHSKTSLIGIIRSERRDYEAQIDKDRALIQTLVNALDRTEDLDNGCPLPTWQKGYDEMCDMRSNALDAAKEQGFTPTEADAQGGSVRYSGWRYYGALEHIHRPELLT